MAKSAFEDVWKKALAFLFVPPCLGRNFKDLPTPLDRVVMAYWYYGYLSDVKTIAPTPNALAMVKILVNGHVSILAIDRKKLLPAMRVILSEDNVKFKDVVAKPEAANADIFSQLHANGCPVFRGVLVPMSCLYVPAGFIVVEKVVKGVLAHGIRRTFLPKSAPDQALLN